MELKWLKKILQKNRSKEDDQAPLAPEVPPRLGLTEVKGWLEEKSYQPEFEKKVSDLYNQIETVAKTLLENLKELESVRPNQDAHPRLLKAGLASREKVVEQMAILCHKLTPPDKMDAHLVEEYHSGIIKHLENTVVKFGRSQRYMAFLFPEESNRLNSNLNQMAHILAELGDIISKRKKDLEIFIQSRDLATQLIEDQREINLLRKDISEDENRLSEIKNDENKLKKELDDWNHSAEGQKKEMLKEYLELRRRELYQVESGMAALISPLNKALSRMVKQDSSDRLNLKNREIFDLLSESPAKAPETDISESLLELRSNVDQLGLKDKIREKTLEHIDHLIQDKPLEAFKARHSEIKKEIVHLEHKLSESLQDAREFEERLHRTGEEAQQLQTRLHGFRKSLQVSEKRMSVNEVKLNKKIDEIAGRPMTIDLTC